MKKLTTEQKRQLLRTINILLDIFYSAFETGLCDLANYAANNEYIDHWEEKEFRNFIYQCRPFNWRNRIECQAYFWEKGEQQPRLDFLRKLKKKLEKSLGLFEPEKL